MIFVSLLSYDRETHNKPGKNADAQVCIVYSCLISINMGVYDNS